MGLHESVLHLFFQTCIYFNNFLQSTFSTFTLLLTKHAPSITTHAKQVRERSSITSHKKYIFSTPCHGFLMGNKIYYHGSSRFPKSLSPSKRDVIYGCSPTCSWHLHLQLIIKHLMLKIDDFLRWRVLPHVALPNIFCQALRLNHNIT